MLEDETPPVIEPVEQPAPLNPEHGANAETFLAAHFDASVKAQGERGYDGPEGFVDRSDPYGNFPEGTRR